MRFDPGKIYWQAHRGGGSHEAPDNTLYAMQYGWSLGGIPEADIRVTADDAVICLHDNTLARTTDAPDAVKDRPVRELTLAELKKYDAGKKFRDDCAGQRIPALSEVFEAMSANPEKMLYCDVKNYDSDAFPALMEGFKKLVSEFGVASQLIVCGCDYELNCRFKHDMPEVHTMQWIGYWGPLNQAEQKVKIFNQLKAKGFACLDLVQYHLDFTPDCAGAWPFDIGEKDLMDALSLLGPRLEVLPWHFDRDAIRLLLKLGVKQFATDEPMRFSKCLQ